MGASENFGSPSWLNPIDSDLDAIRENLNFLLVCSGRAGVIIPGWNTQVTPGDQANYAEPSEVVLTNGTRKIHIRYTWSDGAIATYQLGYNDGVTGLEMFSAQTIDYWNGEYDLIIWAGDPFTSSVEDSNGFVYIYFNDDDTGLQSPPTDSSCTYFEDATTLKSVRVISDETDAVPISTDEYLVKYEIVSVEQGTPVVEVNGNTGEENNWWELSGCEISLQIPSVTWVVHEVILDVTVAIYESGDASIGEGVPVSGSEVTRQVTLYVERYDPS